MRFRKKILHNYVRRNTAHKQEATTFLVTTDHTLTNLSRHTHTHTHTRLTALCPGLPGWAGSEWQWHQLCHMQVCTSLLTDNHASTPPLSFIQAGCPSCRPTNSVKALKAFVKRPNDSIVHYFASAIPLKSAADVQASLVTVSAENLW